MRAVIQKCLRSSVTVDGKIISRIGAGYNVLVGISADDAAADVDWIVNKILKIRLWHSWNKNIGEAHRPQPLLDPLSTSAVAITAPLEILCISQFTLYGKLKGNKVDFHNAMKSAPAKELYDDVLAGLRKELGEARVHDGIFGAMMQVEIINDGPVTIEIDSRARDR